jgi:hypothetical protein
MDMPKPHRPDIRKLRLPADEKEELRRKLMKMNVRRFRWWLGITIICLSPLIGTAIYIWLVVTGRLLAQWRIDWYENLGKLFIVGVGFCGLLIGFPLARAVTRRNLEILLSAEGRCLNCGVHFRENNNRCQICSCLK